MMKWIHQNKIPPCCYVSFQSSLTDTPPEPCAQLFDPSISAAAASRAQTPPPPSPSPPAAVDCHGLKLKQRRSLDEAAVWSALSRATAAGGIEVLGGGGGGGGGGHLDRGGPTAGRVRNGRMRQAKRIDVVSRIFFPLIFAVFNLSYWSSYLYQAARERDKPLS